MASEAHYITLTHKGCNDGFVSKMILGEAFKHATTLKQFEMHAGGDVIEALAPATGLMKNAVLILCDVSAPLDALRSLIVNESCGTVIVLDHHRTAFHLLDGSKQMPSILTQLPGAMNCDQFYELINKECWGDVYTNLDESRSGATLAMLHVGHLIVANSPTEDTYHSMRKVAQLAEDYDLWRHQIKDSAAVNAYLNLLLSQGGDHSKIAFTITSRLSNVISLGETIVETQNTMIDQIVKTKQIATVKVGNFISAPPRALNVPYVFGPKSLASKLGAVLSQDSECGISLVITDTSNDLWNVSVRSKSPEFNTLEISEEFDGGGHVCASGFRINSHSQRIGYVEGRLVLDAVNYSR